VNVNLYDNYFNFSSSSSSFSFARRKNLTFNDEKRGEEEEEEEENVEAFFIDVKRYLLLATFPIQTLFVLM
jgi:hypothetical protein